MTTVFTCRDVSNQESCTDPGASVCEYDTIGQVGEEDRDDKTHLLCHISDTSAWSSPSHGQSRGFLLTYPACT